ncbi:hypothetical protein [Streptomyces sp. NPDC050564]|uniref:hypothetical protein n=1 Tax=Streptomyces sp. NPDC050564 TaxID=3365631 RepID=UPI0037880B0B
MSVRGEEKRGVIAEHLPQRRACEPNPQSTELHAIGGRLGVRTDDHRRLAARRPPPAGIAPGRARGAISVVAATPDQPVHQGGARR